MDTRALEMAGTRALLRNRGFRRLWLAQFSTVTVVYGLSLAGAVLVEEQTRSSTQTGLVILSAILPAFLGSLVSGAVVDRWGRRRVLLASHLARAGVALAFWGSTSLLSPSLALVTVYAVNVAAAACTQFATPSEFAMLPDLVERDRLVSANALLQLSMLAAEGLGIVVLSPLVIRLFGVAAMGLISAGLYLLGASLVATLPQDLSLARPVGSLSSTWKHMWADLQAGWQTIAHDRLLTLVAIQATVAATLLLVLLSLLPGLMSRYMGLGVEGAPILLLPGGLGFVLSSILLSRWEKRMSRPAWIGLGLIGLGMSIGLLGLFSNAPARLWLIVPLVFGIGFALAPVIVSARVVLQERPPAQKRGRVIAAQLALANAAAVIPLLLGGSLADTLGIRPVMGLLGVIALGAGVAGLYYTQSQGRNGET
ncbi:MAG: MFS transporter [Anaerolineae bacterium]